MFKNTYQSGFLSILFAGGSRPLGIWGQAVKNGHIRRVTDEDVQSLALEIMGTNVATTYIICPANKNQTLGIRLPFFIMIVKNMKKYFTFEITVLGGNKFSKSQSFSIYSYKTDVLYFRRGSSYLETLRVQIHANVRIRRIYFSDRLYAEDEMPQEFKLYVPITSQKDKGKGKESLKIVMEDKGTGADKIRVSVAVKAEEEELEGVPPTPTEEAEGEEDMEEGMEAGQGPPPIRISADIGEDYDDEETEIFGDEDEVETIAEDTEGGEEAGEPARGLSAAPAREPSTAPAGEPTTAPDAGAPAPDAGDAGAPAPDAGDAGVPAPEAGDAGAPAPAAEAAPEAEEAPAEAPAQAEPEPQPPSEAPAEPPADDAPPAEAPAE